MTARDTDDRFESAIISQRYRLGEVIGLGGAATVYRAWDLHVHRTVAVKLYRAGAAGTDRPPHRAEVTALTMLRHSGLVALYDAGIDAGRAYLVMQMIDGESLSQRMSRGPLPTASVSTIGAALAGTLAYVHEHGLVHRDIKPANVLLNGRDRPFLTDFGVSRLIDATRSTATGLVLGTPAFLAPEQVRGRTVGPPADVYALGLVLLEALTGKREYPGGAIESAVARLHRAPQLPAQLPEQLRSLLEQMTADNPAARPGAAEVATRLKTTPPAMPRAPVSTGSCGRAGRREFRRRRQLLGALIAATSGAGLGGVMLTEALPTTSVPLPRLDMAEQSRPPLDVGAPPVAFAPPADVPGQPDNAVHAAAGVPRTDIEEPQVKAPPSPARQANAAATRLLIERNDDRPEPPTASWDPSDSEDDTTHRNGPKKPKDKDNGKGKHRGDTGKRGSR